MSKRGDRSFHSSAHAWTDVVGSALLLLLASVVLAASRGDRSHLLTLLLVGAAALVAGRALGTIRRPIPHAVAPWRWVRPAVVACALVFLAVLGTTIVLGAAYREGDEAAGVEGGLRSLVTERRVALWHSALEVLGEQPGGVGPGRFDDVPPRLLPDGEVRWAENDFLQQGAELGWAGLILTVSLFLWGFARSLAHPAPDAWVALGAMALAVLGISASVSHVLHVPVVPPLAALLIGWTQAVRAGSPREQGSLDPQARSSILRRGSGLSGP